MATAIASWYHCGVQVIGRSAGRTATAAAAYRCAARIRDEQTGATHDYTRRHGVDAVINSAPEKAPDWVYDLERFCNEIQFKDNRVNSCLLREVEGALPRPETGVTREQRIEIVQDLADHITERYGVVCWGALHSPSGRGSDDNEHFHLLFGTRRVDENGLGAKTRELDARAGGGQEVQHIREYLAELINDALEEAGSDERVDHRSYEERGIDRLATQHLGHEAAAMERRGEASRIGDYNREVEEQNREMDALVAELAALDAEIAQIQQEMLEPAEEDRAVVLPLEAYKPLTQGPESSAFYQAFRHMLENATSLEMWPGMSLTDYLTFFDVEHQEYDPDKEATLWRDVVDNRRADRDRGRDMDKDDPEPDW